MRSTYCAASASTRSHRLDVPGLEPVVDDVAVRLVPSPSIWMRVWTGVSPIAATRFDGASVGTGALVNRSGWRSISITSACLVIAQNSGNFGTVTRRIGDSARMRAAVACHDTGSA